MRGCLPAAFTDEHRASVCRIGQGAACCRYLTVGAEGWACEKRTSMRHGIDHRAPEMISQGDNCDGVYEPRPAFRLLADRFEHKAGAICYDAKSYDYGLASDDTRATGQPHVSVTLEPSGDYPTFTVAVADLERIEP